MTAQDNAVAQYRAGERSLRTMARWAVQAGDCEGAKTYLRLAHQVGVAMVREARHVEPEQDEWERQYPFGDPAYNLVNRLRPWMGH